MPDMTVERPRRAASRGAGTLAGGLPCGRRTPAGRVRWYLLKMPEGREEAVCRQLLRLVPGSVLADCFCAYKERWYKHAGAWRTERRTLYRGYAFALSPDAAGLAKELSRLTVPAELAGTRERSWAPLDDEAARWFSSVMDAGHVIRNSTAVIVDGVLRVQEGPLVGQEARVRRIDRHRRFCTVAVVDGDGGFTEQMPLDVLFKS